MNELPQCRMPFGAETDELGGTCFRLLVPAARIGSQPARAPQLMAPLADGWFELPLADVGAGARYRFAIDGGPQVPDQASRAQPENVHGASELQPSCLPILAPEPLTPTPEMPQELPIFTIYWSITGKSVQHD